MSLEYYSTKRLEQLGIQIEPRRVLELVEQALDETGSGDAVANKLVTRLDENTTQSTLHAHNPRYAGVKIIGSSVKNPANGLNRYDMTFILQDLQTLQTLCILDGTQNSKDRTGVFPIIAINRTAPTKLDLDVFVFGAGDYADSCVKYLVALLAHRITRLSIKGDGAENSKKLAAKYQAEVRFPVEAVTNLDRLPTANVIITATSNVWKTLFQTAQIKKSGFVLVIVLSEGIEIPDDYIKAAIDSNSVICDSAVAVGKRNGQSLPRYLRNTGKKLEECALELGIKDIHQMKDLTDEQRDRRWLTTFVGIGTTDLALAEEWFRMKNARA